MNWQTAVAIAVLSLSGIASLIIAAFIWRQRITWARSFAFTTIAIAIWDVGYAFEIGATTIAAKTFWAQFQYIGISTIPLGWYLFAQAYAGRRQWITRRRILILITIPVITLILAFTNSWHHLFWTTIALNNNGPFSIFDASYGPGWFVFLIYSYGLILTGSVILFLSLRNISYAYRWQLTTLLSTPILPLLGNILFILRLSPIPQLDLSPFLFTMSILILSLGIMRFNLFVLAPVARSTLIEQMRDAMLVLDNQNRIVDINPVAEHLFNVTNTPAIGQSIHQLAKGWSNFPFLQFDTSYAQNEFESQIKEEEQHYILHVSPIYDQQENFIGRLVLLQKITTLKEAEEIYARAQAKTELLAKVGHELLTPLNGILGLVEMLDFGVYGSVSTEQQKALSQIVGRTNHLTGLVKGLLRQIRLERGDFQLELKMVVMRDLVIQIRDILTPLAQEKGLTLSINLADNVPKEIVGDPTRLNQIFINLIENSIKFSDEGSISVKIYCPNQKYLTLSISDTGIGIPKEMQKRIFDAFEQVDHSLTQKTGGVGLGLAIVKQLVDLMDGKINLTSIEGQGSTFTVTLPLLSEADIQNE